MDNLPSDTGWFVRNVRESQNWNSLGRHGREKIHSLKKPKSQREGNKHYYYEIETVPCVRSCLRQAISQLFEYSYWPGGNEAKRLVAVSENALTPDAKKYIRGFRQRFNLPLFYRCLDMDAGVLGPCE